jgi:ribonuclease D
MVEVRVVDDEAQRQGAVAFESFCPAVEQAIANSSRVAFDCEGVNLSRAGSLEIVSLCFEEDTSVIYLVDVGSKGDSSLRQERLNTMKRLFECATVTKVIHDCRMDCDSLHHLFGITLKGVHDTQCYHYVIHGVANLGLNDTLKKYGFEANDVRDKDVYKRNLHFGLPGHLRKR